MTGNTGTLPETGGTDSPDPVAMIAQQIDREQGRTSGAPLQPAAPDRKALEAAPEPDPSTPDEDGTDPEPEPEDTEDPPEEDPESEPEPEPELFTVKVDGGRELQVTRDELIRGYHRLSDYTRKTQEVAAVRQQVEAEAQRIAAEREHYAQQLDQFARVMAESLPQEPDWVALAQQDPQGYAVAKELWEQRGRQFQQMAQERQRLAHLQALEQERQKATLMQHEQQRLLDVLPEWRDGTKAQAEQRDIHRTLRDTGYSDEEIAGVMDARAVVIAREAMLYRKLMAAKPSVDKRVANAPKMVKPGSSSPAPDKRKALLQQLKRTGSVDDAAALIMARR